MIKKLFLKFRQFIMFGIVGASNTAISMATFYSLNWIFDKNQLVSIAFLPSYQIANLASFILSSLNGYFWSSRFVFNKGRGQASFVKFYISYIFTYFLGSFQLFLYVEKFGIVKNIAFLIGLCITIPINFLLNKYWTFRVKEDNM